VLWRICSTNGIACIWTLNIIFKVIRQRCRFYWSCKMNEEQFTVWRLKSTPTDTISFIGAQVSLENFRTWDPHVTQELEIPHQTLHLPMLCSPFHLFSDRHSLSVVMVAVVVVVSSAFTESENLISGFEISFFHYYAPVILLASL